jgi:hypothetical protein
LLLLLLLPLLLLLLLLLLGADTYRVVVPCREEQKHGSKPFRHQFFCLRLQTGSEVTACCACGCIRTDHMNRMHKVLHTSFDSWQFMLNLV